MCIPRKPHPFGNEYHLIANGDNGANYVVSEDRQGAGLAKEGQGLVGVPIGVSSGVGKDDDNKAENDKADSWEGEGCGISFRHT